MSSELNCSKCSGVMLAGFILDHGHLQVKQQQMWVEGAPETSFWSGLKTSDRAIYKVRAMRCSRCGFLEFYTDEKADLGGEYFT